MIVRSVKILHQSFTYMNWLDFPYTRLAAVKNLTQMLRNKNENLQLNWSNENKMFPNPSSWKIDKWIIEIEITLFAWLCMFETIYKLLFNAKKITIPLSLSNFNFLTKTKLKLSFIDAAIECIICCKWVYHSVQIQSLKS